MATSVLHEDGKEWDSIIMYSMLARKAVCYLLETKTVLCIASQVKEVAALLDNMRQSVIHTRVHFLSSNVHTS